MRLASKPLIPSGWSVEALVAAGSFAAVLLASFSWTVATGDEATWHYMGWAWMLHHVPLYTGSVDNKPPGVLSLFALSSALFGVTLVPVRILGVCAVAATDVTLFKLAERLMNRRAGLLTAIIFCLASCWTGFDAGFSDTTEIFLDLFVSLAFLATTSPQPLAVRAALTGLFGGIALSFKQTALLSGLALFFALLSQGAGIMEFGVFVVGGLVGMGIFLAPVLLTGTRFRDYLEFVWFVLVYPNVTSAPNVLVRIDSFVKTWLGPVRAFYPFAFLFFLKRRQMGLKQLGWPVIAAWLGLEFIAVNGGGVTHPHQIKEILPVLSIVTAGGIEFIVASAFLRPAAAIVCTILFFFPDGIADGALNARHYLYQYRIDDAALNALRSARASPQATATLQRFKDVPLSNARFNYVFADAFGSRANEAGNVALQNQTAAQTRHIHPTIFYEDDGLEAVGDWLRLHTTPQDRVYAFARGNAGLVMMYAQRLAPTRFFATYMVYGYHPYPYAPFESEIRASLAAAPPKFVLISDPLDGPPDVPPAWLTGFVAARYQRLFSLNGFVIYQRNGG